MKKNVRYILLLIGAVALVVAVEVLSPKPVDWTPTYSQRDKNPFGSSLVYERLPDIFPGQPVRSINETLFQRSQTDSLPVANYLFVTNYFEPGQEDIRMLLQLADEGSQIFIAASAFADSFADTLGFKTSSDFSVSDTVQLTLSDPSLRAEEPYQYKRVYYRSGFEASDSTKQTPFRVLGTDADNHSNFVRLPYGKGYFYLHTVPQAYTNYNLLRQPNEAYLAKTLSYLPVQPTYWNEHYSDLRTESQTPFRFILSQPPLRWALYVSLITLVLFMVFEAKRKQRIIPIVKPLSNTTLEFTETVGRLYFQYKDHKNIAEKKITYFLEYVRAHFYVKTTELNEALSAQLAEKTGVERAAITGLFQLIAQIRSRSTVTEAELRQLNESIEAFYDRNRKQEV